MASPPPPAPAAAAAHSVFVYGTLMAEEVVRVLLGRVPPSSPALLPNQYVRACALRSTPPGRLSIRGRVYPAILPVDGSKVPGKVWQGITDRELDVLDIFEDEEYVRETVGISLADSADMIAYAYIWGNVDDPDLYGEWDFDEWKKVHLKDYITMTQDFREELEQLESETHD
ncbi:AIG2-like protein D isoform X1 [Aegilops tauschii subsp. strangulata]|uniref:AIG2-like protein D isoform X1 n=1 Tax=Aegilops tauschii subsp. strangulata TaxID=200361 RepID=UPI000989FF8C|nr:AIG2-like protein D isoform X1 [Aegilops tauschii subsp. strangulata]